MPAEVRNCGNCIYFVGEEECHWNPPSPVPKYNQSGYTSEWAKVESLDWCGQWMADFLVQAKPGPVA